MNNLIMENITKIVNYNANTYRNEDNINRVLTILAEYDEYNPFFTVIQKFPRTNKSIIVSSDVLVGTYLNENSSKCLKLLSCEKIKNILFKGVDENPVNFSKINQNFINTIIGIPENSTAEDIESKCPLLKKFIDNKNKFNTRKKYNIKDVFDRIKLKLANMGRLTC